MKKVKFRKKPFQKLFTYLLSFMMIFSSFTPTVINAADDDWNIRLNWGDFSENLPDEFTLTADSDSSYAVKLQVTIEYTGANTKTYAPEEVQIHLSDIYDLTGLTKYSSTYMTLDVAAEEKGSNSGKGDWYYTRTFNEETKTNDYVFTNKNSISSSFTSTFQMVFTFHKVREYLNNNFTKELQASLALNESTINTNKLTFNYKSIKDTYDLAFLTPTELEWPNRILSQLDKENWDDYIFIDVPIETSITNRNVNALDAGYHLDLNLPDDIIYYLHSFDSNIGNRGIFSGSDVSKYSTVEISTSNNVLSYALALPREKYLNLGTVTLDANWFGTYIGNQEEELLDTDSISINVHDFDYVYSGELYSSEKKKYGLTYLYKEVMEYGYGKTELIGNTQTFDVYASAVYYGVPYNLIIGDDLQYFIYKDNTFRQLQDDEIVLDTVTVTNPSTQPISFELWVKPVGQEEFILYANRSFTQTTKGYQFNLVKNSTRYSDVYVRFLGIEETIDHDEYLQIITRIYDNKTLDNNKEITDFYNLSYMKIELLDEEGNVAETVEMEDFGITNIEGLAEAVNELDNADGNTKLRSTDSLEVEKVRYSTDLSLTDTGQSTKIGTENIYFQTGLIQHQLYNRAELETSIKKYTMSYDYPSVLSVDVDNILFTRFGDRSYPTDTYTIDEVQKLDNTIITYSIKENGDGTNTLTLNIDATNLTPSWSSSDIWPVMYATNVGFYISIDDYYLLDLEGTNAKFTVNDPQTDTIYNMCNNMYYKRSGSGSRTFYMLYPSVARNSYQGINKLIAVKGDEYSLEQQKVEFNDDYSYKLRLSSMDTQMANIVIYDQFENENPCSWFGEYKGYSFEGMEKTGIDTSKFKVYYSSNRNQTQNLAASGWILEENWTNNLSEVKSIAFELKDYVMKKDELFYVEVFMKTPSTGVEGDLVKNKATTSYVEYDLDDTDLLTPLKVTTNLASNITKLYLGDAKININVTKTWDDSNNDLSLRPKEITVRLWQNGMEIANKALSADNEWETSFSNYRKFDDEFKEYVYTITEDAVFGYNNNVTSSIGENAIEFAISNTLDKEKVCVNIFGSKTWDDFDNIYGLRPDSITVDLYQDDIKIKSITTNEEKEWKYTFTDLPKYKNDNELYEYSIKEQVVENYIAEYSSSNLENGLAITFNENCKTENRYDYLKIYYNLNGKTYVTQSLTGTTFAGTTIYIPSHDFYLYWYSDYSQSSYYGFKIDSIESCEVDVNNLNYTTSTLPSVTVTELSGNNYPESQHNGYGNDITELYHYAYDTSLVYKSYDIKNTLKALEDSQELIIGKKLYVDDIWLAHGNPTFIFKVEGHDIFNKEVIKYVSLEFTEEYIKDNSIGTGQDAIVIQKKTLKLAPGNYTVSEVQVLRYELTKIDAVNSSEVTETNASFDLKVNNNGECIFTNRCINYKDYSHNDIVINKFGK